MTDEPDAHDGIDHERTATDATGGWSRRSLLRTAGAVGAAASVGTAAALDARTVEEEQLATDEPRRLYDDLEDASGVAYHEDAHALYVVESGPGTLSRVDFVPESADAVAEGEFEVPLDVGVDLDRGEAGVEEGADVRWTVGEEGRPQLVPGSGSGLAVLGVDRGDVEPEPPELLATADFGDDPVRLRGDEPESRRDVVAPGTELAVETGAGNYARVFVHEAGEALAFAAETYATSDRRTVLGEGYHEPRDVVVSEDGQRAYVTEAEGLLAVNLEEPGREAAKPVVDGLEDPQQIALHDAHEEAYVVEGVGAGRLLRVDLEGGDATTLFEGMEGAAGLVVDPEESVAYVSERLGETEGVLSRIDLVAGHREVLVEGLANPYRLEWASEGRDALVVPEHEPVNRISRLDLVDLDLVPLVEDFWRPPLGAELVGRDELVLFCPDWLDLLDLFEDFWIPPLFPPLIHAIGSIPSTDVTNGRATTTNSRVPGRVRDAPFGRTLRIKLNFEIATSWYGAEHYKVYVDGDEEATGFKRYLWDFFDGEYDDVPAGRTNGYFDVVKSSLWWDDPRLGYVLDSTQFDDGRHTLRVEFFDDSFQQVAEDTLELEIDNDDPQVHLPELAYEQRPNDWEEVTGCSVVDEGTGRLRATLTVDDKEGHLRAWNLVSRHGRQGSNWITGQSYPGQTSGPLWRGPNGGNQLTETWTSANCQCAHYLRLKGWGRATDGYSYIHRNAERITYTMMLDSSTC